MEPAASSYPHSGIDHYRASMDNAEPWAEGVFGNGEVQPHSQAVVEQLKQKKRQHTPGTAVGEVFDTPQAQQKAKLVHLQP